MHRWMEQVELKHAQLMRTVLYFQKHAEIWASMAKDAPSAGARSYANKQSAIFETRRVNAYVEYKDSARPELLSWEQEELIGRVQAWRHKEFGEVRQRHTEYVYVYI